ncbi:ATP-dependent DNA helicase [Parapusillimonas sp. SGNA-6]|nr:ATP-dependent DNA helicase [Parapusillimonas sp. SGNA-6]
MNYTVAVRALCEFTAKTGDLDLRFTPSPTAQEGIEGHAIVRAGRRPGYQSEISLSEQYRHLLVRGRADGYDPELNRLEEIKTHRGTLETMPANQRALHWAQAKMYGHLLCRKLGLDQMELALVYYDIVDRKETLLTESCTAADLEQHFVAHCERFLHWAELELVHRQTRDDALKQLAFPHPAFRPGQRQLAETVYKATRQQRSLLAQAPTGIGKTIGATFPVLKACPADELDKVFFLAAKTSGRQIAIDGLKTILAHQPKSLRVLELVARDKACEYPGRACHGEACPLARGFYDRLPEARMEAVTHALLDKASLRDIALRHDVCPYWLSQDLVQWSDVIVGDYNYYFDASALLYGLTVANQWRVAVLVDEAHNLLDRARSMYSMALHESDLQAVRADAPPALKKTLGYLARCWKESWQDQTVAYQAYDAVPTKLKMALMRASAELTEHLAQSPQQGHTPMHQLHFDILRFLGLAEVLGPHSVFDITLVQARHQRAQRLTSVLCLRNVIPAPFLEERFAASHSTTLFSATLSPWPFYRDTLGLPENTAWVDVASPFASDQLAVNLVSHISTRYQHRLASVQPIADLMAAQFRQAPGNYLSYFSSFDYLQQVADAFTQRYPDIPVWRQSRNMDEAGKEDFLARFTEHSTGIGFAVLGGAFAEGIDLPGKRLIGAFVSTLGLPQVNPVNERLKQSMATVFGAQHGYDYTYLYPGIQKVVQAAGRVIRSQSDRGVVYLIDDRYLRPNIQALLPHWWQWNVRSEPLPDDVQPSPNRRADRNAAA